MFVDLRDLVLKIQVPVGDGVIYECAVIGGGLAGLAAAMKFAESGASVVIFDKGLPEAAGQLGGFAKFSGAKFSLLPAGQGLIPLAGSEAALRKKTDVVLQKLGLSGSATLASRDRKVADNSALTLRTYHSIVLTPKEMDALIIRGTELLDARVVRSSIVGIKKEEPFALVDENGDVHRAKYVLYAGGRYSNALLEDVGAVSQEGKGLDFGLRLEFDDLVGLKPLRDLGPDAKILKDRTRTFCLNLPGIVYRYPFADFSIPGGVVASPEHAQSNVGILTRVEGKKEALAQAVDALSRLTPGQIIAAPVFSGRGLGPTADKCEQVYGVAVTEELSSFLDELSDCGLVDLSRPHRLHFPLIDWHWPTYGGKSSAATSVEGLYVAGDSAGNARGLLQAAVSGWLAAEEILACT